MAKKPPFGFYDGRMAALEAELRIAHALLDAAGAAPGTLEKRLKTALKLRGSTILPAWDRLEDHPGKPGVRLIQLYQAGRVVLEAEVDACLDPRDWLPVLETAWLQRAA